MTDNEAVVRAVFDQTARGDSDAATESFAPGAEIGSLAHPERVLRGPEDVRGYLAEMESAGETFEAVPERFVAAGERVAVTGRLRTRNRRSGATTDVPGAWVYTLRDGLIVRVEAFGDPADALAALGPDTLVA